MRKFLVVLTSVKFGSCCVIFSILILKIKRSEANCLFVQILMISTTCTHVSIYKIAFFCPGKFWSVVYSEWINKRHKKVNGDV